MWLSGLPCLSPCAVVTRPGVLFVLRTDQAQGRADIREEEARQAAAAAVDPEDANGAAGRPDGGGGGGGHDGGDVGGAAEDDGLEALAAAAVQGGPPPAAAAAAAGAGAGAAAAESSPPIGTIKGLMEQFLFPQLVSQVGEMAPHPPECQHHCCDQIWVVDATEDLDVRVCRLSGCPNPPAHIQHWYCPAHRHLEKPLRAAAGQQQRGEGDKRAVGAGAAAAGEGGPAAAAAGGSSGVGGSGSGSPGSSSSPDRSPTPPATPALWEALGLSAAMEAAGTTGIRRIKKPRGARLTGKKSKAAYWTCWCLWLILEDAGDYGCIVLPDTWTRALFMVGRDDGTKLH